MTTVRDARAEYFARAGFAPDGVMAAFRRGRRSGNLYAGELCEELLDVEVEELRRRLRL
ncbi:MAG TPA: hypothetical protein VF266_18970 [Thermoanaerobaculia bacterium]